MWVLGLKPGSARAASVLANTEPSFPAPFFSYLKNRLKYQYLSQYVISTLMCNLSMQFKANLLHRSLMYRMRLHEWKDIHLIKTCTCKNLQGFAHFLKYSAETTMILADWHISPPVYISFLNNE